MDREEFTKRLYSTVIPEGAAPEDIQALTRPVSEAIREMMPKRLFRYRAYNELSVDAFQNDIIYALTADKFNDPYDSLFRYDKDKLRNSNFTGVSKEMINQFQKEKHIVD